jgi:16S rRNA (guanine527-N7)-methyltransferase
MYIDILLRWNSRMNLTAVRDPEAIVTRHFGESLFEAWNLFPEAPVPGTRVADIGSGAGFPGIPLKVWSSTIHLSLIESNQKKATFLKEVTRALALTGVDVFSQRAEGFPACSADLVTMRAVENFERSLTTATGLASPAGQIALLIGQSQLEQAYGLPLEVAWRVPIPVPESITRVLLVGSLKESAL